MPANLHLAEFVEILQSHFWAIPQTATKKHIVHDAQSYEVEQALSAPGRTLIIYGDRRLGSADISLAQKIAAYRACELNSGALGRAGDSSNQAASHTTHAELEIDTAEDQQTAADDAFSSAASGKEPEVQTTVFVIDEFNTVTTDEERRRFADFVHHISDLPIHVILCGVSESLEELLQAHESRSRYVDDFAGIPDLGVLSAKLDALGKRAPHYVNVVSEELFWEMFNDPTFARRLH